jgi:hypothetical protein
MWCSGWFLNNSHWMNQTNRFLQVRRSGGLNWTSSSWARSRTKTRNINISVKHSSSIPIDLCLWIEKISTEYLLSLRMQIRSRSRIRDRRNASSGQLDLLTGPFIYGIDSNMCWINWHIGSIAASSGGVQVLQAWRKEKPRSVHEGVSHKHNKANSNE